MGPEARGHRPDPAGLGAGPRDDGPGQGRRQGSPRLGGPHERRRGDQEPDPCSPSSPPFWPPRPSRLRRSGRPLRAYLPSDGAAPGWTQDGEPQEFEGEDLYTYIDGGAEIYQEYGFRRVVVQDYRNAGGSPSRSRSSRWSRPRPRTECSRSRDRGRAEPRARRRGRDRGLLPEFLEGAVPRHADGIRRGGGNGRRARRDRADRGFQAPGRGRGSWARRGLAGRRPPARERQVPQEACSGSIISIPSTRPGAWASRDAVLGLYDSGETLILLELRLSGGPAFGLARAPDRAREVGTGSRTPRTIWRTPSFS
ncbi:MAG: hypothetical protein M0C28_39200 [Candidatus Moduliflexus flocculans]|nr:hypothetical protein [Candidatus Moduliflexus flocculans]